MKLYSKLYFGVWMILSLLTACSEDTLLDPHVENDGSVMTLAIDGSTSSDANSGSRAYMDSDRGVRWMKGDRLTVIPDYSGYMMDFPFEADESSEGKLKGHFDCTGDFASYAPTWFASSKAFVACYPQLATETSDTRASASTPKTPKKRCKMPSTYTQVGKNSLHLKKYLYMFSGLQELTEGLREVRGQYLLPNITFKHKTSIHRFRITNRQPYPIKLKSAQLTVLKSGTTTEYPLFYQQADVDMITLSETLINDGAFGPYATITVNLEGNEGEPYYELQPAETMDVYAPSFNADLSGMDLKFTVTDESGSVYNTLALPGSKIQNGKFENGKCYTYNLLVDNALTLQEWDADYMDNINFGQQSLTLSTDNVVLPTDASRSETVTVQTTDALGWRITSKPEWVTASVSSGGTGESQVTFSATAPGSESGYICIMSGNVKKTLFIQQSDSYEYTSEVFLPKSEMKNKARTSYILEDTESTDILYNASLRSFKTTQPLQYEITSDGQLHLRFYSPRKLTNVQVWATVPGIVDEEFLLAELEEMAPFADTYANLPEFGTKDLTFRTRSGKKVTFKTGPTFPVKKIQLRVTSSCPYWKMLQAIKVTWNVAFTGYYNHEYCKQDYIMKGAHCREAVALALNNTYMFSTTEFRDFMFGLQGKLFSDTNGKNFIDTRNMYYNKICKTYDMTFGLTTTAGFTFLGGGRFFIKESSYLTHYADDATDKLNAVIWHEFGHVLGYTHDGNITFPAGQEGIGWSVETADFYHQMSKAKNLPIYSRRFLHTRDREGSSLYENKWRVTEWHSFGTTPEEDAELYEIDNGKLWYL